MVVSTDYSTILKTVQKPNLNLFNTLAQKLGKKWPTCKKQRKVIENGGIRDIATRGVPVHVKSNVREKKVSDGKAPVSASHHRPYVRLEKQQEWLLGTYYIPLAFLQR